MRVSQTQRSKATQGRRSARGTTGRGGPFKLPAGREAARRSEISGPAPVGSVDTLIALQAVDETSERRREAVDGGDRILDLLDQLKIGLLSGHVRPESLRMLKSAVERQQNIDDDPGLKEVLKQIDLRARVELAKLKGHAA
jgi:hypothetical protein